jgi:hypothetical protein
VTAGDDHFRHRPGAQVIVRSQVAVEAHAFAATAYVTGPLTASVVARTIMACRALPSTVRGVRVDLRAVSTCDLDALVMLEAHIVEWRAHRRGVSRMSYPRLPAREAFVGIPCTVRDDPDAELRPERDDRVGSRPPYVAW